MYKELSASTITAQALTILRSQGHRVRRTSNVSAYKKRARQVEPGWPDIQGYTSKGLQILCEVKKIGDTLKPAQRERLVDLKSVGGIAIIATQRNDRTVLIDIEDY